MFKRIGLALLLAASTATAQQPSAQQQPPAYGEKLDVNLVLLDAVVTDRRGNQILGLDKNDFVVKENGVAQSIDSVDYFTNRKLLDQPEAKAPFKAEQLHEQRYFIFFFDKPTGSGALFFDRLSMARRSVRDFIEKQMKPADMAAVVAHDMRLKVYSDFTSDKKQLEKAVDESATNGRGLMSSSAPAGVPSLLRGVGGDRLMNETGTVYEGLEALGDATRGIRARKNIVLFSLGIHEPGEEVRDGMLLSNSRFYDPMIEALNRGNVTVYPIQLLDSAELPPFIHQTLERIAGDTNGEYFRLNTSFGPAMKRIEAQTNGYYLISYYTTPKRGRGFQKVDVALKNPDFRIKARQGYAYGSGD